MAQKTIQSAANWGEISPTLYGRTEMPQYRAGCSTMRNMFVIPQGGATSRAGTQFCGQCLQEADENSTPPEFIPYINDIELTYCLELGGQYMRILFDGAYVVEDSITVSTATNASPGVFGTAVPHGYAVDDWVYLTDFLGMTQVNGHTYAIDTTPTTTSFTLRSTLSGVTLSTVAFGTYTVSTGTVARVLTIDTPYAIDDVRAIKWSQDANVMSLVHPDYKPYDIERLGHNDWTVTTTSFTVSIAAPETANASPSTTTATTLSTRYLYVVTAIDAESGEESTASPVAGVTNSVNISLTLGSITVNWSSVTGAAYYNIYKAPASYAVDTPAGTLFGYMATSYGLSFVDTNIVPDFTITPPLHYNPFATSSIIFFSMTATGSGYTTSTLAPPLVAVGDPTGVGATGYAVVQSGGVYAIILTHGGEGYTNPQVAISSSGGGTGAAFTATAATGSFWYGAVTVTNTGSSYPSGTILLATWTQSGWWTQRSAFSTTVSISGGHITAASFADPVDGAGHRPLAASVAISVYGGAGVGATATASIGPSTGTYPSVVSYFNQRRFYANTLNEPDTYWGSRPGAYTNMDRSLPTVDDDAIVGTPWAQQVNGIQWMIPMPGGLVILTGGGAWQLNGGNGGTPITPADQNAQAQAYTGCSPIVRPLTINYDILYLEHDSSHVRDLAYSVVTNIYSGTDLTLLSNHLFDNFAIRRWDWSEQRHKLVWACRDDGVLLSLAYLKEQNVYGWSRHDTRGLFQSVAVISEPPVDTPYFVVKRYVDGRWVYYAERMRPRLWTNIEDAWCVDCALAYPQDEPDATLTASAADGDGNVSSYLVTAGGTGYTAPTGIVIDASGLGVGATVTIGISAGVIVSATAVLEGEGYVGPVTVVISDTTGSGGAITGVVTNYVTVAASSGVFTAGNEGNIIRMGGGRLEVVDYLSSTSITANVIIPITKTMPNDPDNQPLPVGPGDWTIATPTSTVSGLDHLEGMAVNGLADGGVIGLTTVVNGSITLPAEASKILVGLPYMVQMQTLYIESPEGSNQGQRGQPVDVVMRVEASYPPKVGANQPDQAVQPFFATVDWENMGDVQNRVQTLPAGQAQPLFTGDYFTNVFANWDTSSQIAFQQEDPVPLTILSLMPSTLTGDKK